MFTMKNDNTSAGLWKYNSYT